MKKIITYILAISLTGVGFSCENSLDIENPNEISEQGFWKNADDALAGVNAIYSAFYRSGTYARWLPIYYDPRSDDGFASTGWGALKSAVDFTQVDYNFEGHRNIWDHHYRAIFRANQVLAYVPGIQMDEFLKQRYLAEAKFLRALHYFNLVSLWGSVPLVLQPSKPADLPFQASAAETWSQIEKDLMEAAPNLPPSYDGANLGRATRGAAFALLGKAHMQQREYQAAVDAFRYLVEGEGKSLYDLMPNYRDNFLHTTENNKESVFEIQFKAQQSTTDAEDGPTSNLGNQHGPFFGPGNGAGFNDFQMHRWVVDEFLKERTASGARDPRLATTALFRETDERGPAFSRFYGRTFSSMMGSSDQRVWYRKYLNDYHRTDETFEGPINYRVIRYADVLLMYAEALNELNRTAEAYQYVDRVRQRVGLARLADIKPNMSKEAFFNQLMHERITELTGEGVRWLDLFRWGYFDNAARINELKARDPEFNNFTIGKDKWLPIPQSELDINPNLVQVF